jgi:hypothetical protein
MTDLYDGRDLIEHERGGNVVPYTGSLEWGLNLKKLLWYTMMCTPFSQA